MSINNTHVYPPLYRRLFGVWLRHMRVYTQNIFSNGLPPFLEPLLFLAGVGLGLSHYVTESMEGLGYIEFLGTGLLVTASMFTAVFECTFGTFIRLEFERVYDGMLAAPMTVNNLIVGEILWVGTKGLFFSFAVMCVLTLFGVVTLTTCWPAPLVGFLTGTMFGCLSLFITSFVKTINHFNFYITGVISPMFFFCGVVFPLGDFPVLHGIAQLLPLTHSVHLVRAFCTQRFSLSLLWNVTYIALFIAVMGWLAVRRFRHRLIQ